MRRAVLVAAALAAGAAHALSFAPFNLPWLQLLAPGMVQGMLRPAARS